MFQWLLTAAVFILLLPIILVSFVLGAVFSSFAVSPAGGWAAYASAFSHRVLGVGR